MQSGGRFYARIATGSGQSRAFHLPTCHDERAAQARTSLLAAWAARLREAGKGDAVLTVLDGASRVADDQIDTYAALVDRLAGAAHVAVKGKPNSGDVLTFQKFAQRWTSGELAREWPDLVATKSSADDDENRLRTHVYPRVGNIPLQAFTALDFERIMRELPASLSPASRRHVAQVVTRVFRLALYPARVIARNPLEGVRLPRLDRKAMATLYPDEEARLLACVELPLAFRITVGFLSREGCRLGEALGDPSKDRSPLRWRDLDLERGAVRVVDTKTGEERSWMMDPGVTRALSRWSKVVPSEANEPVFPKVGRANFARALRDGLKTSGVTRPELFESTKLRRQMRAHDLRGVFVTTSLANGKTESWVMARTGHDSSEMVGRYRRTARHFDELNLGALAPLDVALAGLPGEPSTPPGGPNGTHGAHRPPTSDESAGKLQRSHFLTPTRHREDLNLPQFHRVDASLVDSKSAVREGVSVRSRPSAPGKSKAIRDRACSVTPPFLTIGLTISRPGRSGRAAFPAPGSACDSFLFGGRCAPRVPPAHRAAATARRGGPRGRRRAARAPRGRARRGASPCACSG